MITFKSTKMNGMSDIPIADIEIEIKRVYGLDEAETLIMAFHDGHLGSNLHPLKDEDGTCSGGYGTYYGDVAAIFGLLKVPVKFIDVNGKELAINGDYSGVYC
jgi:hypothetical protein